jgi:ankyrin repeat protein
LDSAQRNCFETSVQRGHLDVALYLVDRCGARPRTNEKQFSLLHLLAVRGNATALQPLLKMDGFSTLATTEKGNTILHLAALAGHRSVGVLHPLPSLFVLFSLSLSLSLSS